MLVYPSGVDVSSSALRFLSACLREHRRALRTRWRRLTAGRQALLALAHLRNGHTYAQLAAGFSVGTTTVYRYVTEAVDLLADLAPTLSQAARTASMKAFVILDGTLLPIDRIAADRPFYSGKHTRHGRTCRSSPTRWVVSSEPPRLFPEPCMTSGRPASTASSTPSPRPASNAGRTRDTRVPAARSVSPTAAVGTAFPQDSMPSIGRTRRSAHASSRPSQPSNPGGSSASSVAPRPGSPTSSKPSSPSIWPAQTEDGKRSLTTAKPGRRRLRPGSVRCLAGRVTRLGTSLLCMASIATTTARSSRSPR